MLAVCPDAGTPLRFACGRSRQPQVAPLFRTNQYGLTGGEDALQRPSDLFSSGRRVSADRPCLHTHRTTLRLSHGTTGKRKARETFSVRPEPRRKRGGRVAPVHSQRLLDFSSRLVPGSLRPLTRVSCLEPGSATVWCDLGGSGADCDRMAGGPALATNLLPLSVAGGRSRWAGPDDDFSGRSLLSACTRPGTFQP